jgi:NhaP-type Na+/H+ and K+/H+ antiporter
MAALDAISIAILLGSLLVLAGILSSLIALRFGAPLLLVFLLVGMLAGEGGPGGLKFDDVQVTYVVGSIALALILFDGGLRTRIATFRNVLAPSVMLATVGVLITTLITAPFAKFVLGIGWLQAMLVGAVVASTDAAAVFFLINARGLRLRPRVRAVLEVESGTNDPFAVFLALLIVEMLLANHQSWSHALITLARDTLLGILFGYTGGKLIAAVLNRVNLAQGLHAPFVAVGAVAVFAFCNAVHTSGFLAVYLAGLVVGNQQTRAHNSVVVFLDAITWLAQIVMFVLLGLLAWPHRLADSIWGAIVVVLVLTVVARPAAVFLCLAPFNFQWREKLFISWVGLRGAVGIFLASIPLLVGLPAAYLFFDVAFVVVLFSLLVQGWSVAFAAAAARRARPARATGARDRRLSAGAEQPLHATRIDPELGAPDNGGTQRADPDAAGGAAAAERRLRLSAGAAREGAGARPLLRRHAAAGETRSTPARRFLRTRHGDARRARRHLRPAGGGRACRPAARVLLCRTARPRASCRRCCRAGADRIARPPGRRWPRGHGRPEARRAGAAGHMARAAHALARQAAETTGLKPIPGTSRRVHRYRRSAPPGPAAG